MKIRKTRVRYENKNEIQNTEMNAVLLDILWTDHPINWVKPWLIAFRDIQD